MLQTHLVQAAYPCHLSPPQTHFVHTTDPYRAAWLLFFFSSFSCCGLVVVVVVADGGGGCDWLLKFVVDVFIIILMSYSNGFKFFDTSLIMHSV